MTIWLIILTWSRYQIKSVAVENSKKWRLEFNSLVWAHDSLVWAHDSLVWAHGNACDCCECVTLKNSTGLNLINKQASCRPQRLSKTEILSFIYLGTVFQRVVSAINHINYCTVNIVLRNPVNLVNNGPQKSARIKVVRCKREWLFELWFRSE